MNECELAPMGAAAAGRGLAWLAGLTQDAAPLAGYPASLRVVDAELDGRAARFIAVVPDGANPFPRARHGEVGLAEGWQLARAVHQWVDAHDAAAHKPPIVAIVDVPSQAYGRLEEAWGLHQALAAAVAAYARARLAGHPVIGLIVGNAISGAFLAHGYQANRLIALDDSGVQVHAMGKASAARVTQRSVEQLEALALRIPPMAYDVQSYASLGLLWRSLHVAHPDAPGPQDLATAGAALRDALASIRSDPDRGLAGRLDPAGRPASARVRERLRQLWDEA